MKNKIIEYIILTISSVLILTSCSQVKGSGGENKEVIEIITKVTGDGLNKSDKVSPLNGEAIDKNTGRDEKDKKENKDIEQEIICEIKGEVKKPGVYKLKEKDRIEDLILMAGGLTDQADLTYINRAKGLVDSESVYIPNRNMTKEEINKITLTNNETKPLKTKGDLIGKKPEQLKDEGLGEEKDKININIATKEELESIPGIGPVLAQNILNYREENGPFKEIEELKEVNRIGDKTFLKLKPFVTVK